MLCKAAIFRFLGSAFRTFRLPLPLLSKRRTYFRTLCTKSLLIGLLLLKSG
ncbi:hypothetical protein [Hugenholtzia roseola]|uniref:hypothetical protein n=1 Tax=Hugenholtzia roseola TaxID=1002 RepID=UPI000422B6BC|nr:hypothetical protein [Hugenholtzia roseola]